MGRLDDRVAVITGAGRGIGRAIALAFAREGCRIVVSSRTERELDDVVGAAKGFGSAGRVVVADAMDRHQARRPVQVAMEEFERVDILVNNVGGTVGKNHDPYTCDDDVFEDTLTLNLVSAFWTSREALPHMRAAAYGRIISIGSGSSKHASSRLGYTTAKHALVGFTRQLAAATALDGITVNCLCPGWTNTTLVDFEKMGRAQGVSTADARAHAEADNLQHRILEPEELAPMATLLASPDGAGITGQVISVDGGYRV